MCLHPGVVYKVIQRSLADYFIVIHGFGRPSGLRPSLLFRPTTPGGPPDVGGLSARTHRSRSGPVLAHVISHDLRRVT